jgi:putative ABC transport system ATP-binding protein
MTKIVNISDLIFNYNRHDKPILNIKSFILNEAEHVFLFGSSGSGKSTLLKLISGLLVATSGKVEVLGKNLSTLKVNERDIFRGNYIGFIFQQFNLIPYLSVIDNVLLPCNFSKVRKGDINIAKDLLKYLDLNENNWNKRADNLSIGQQQRVACARALIGRPPIIIADEPTSALDIERQQGFLDLLKRQCREVKTSLLFVSHNKGLSVNFDRTISLEEIKCDH